MSTKEMVFKIEDLSNEAMKINSMQKALFEAIYKGDNALDTYEWAFVAFGELTYALTNELETLSEKAFELLRSDNEKVA